MSKFLETYGVAIFTLVLIAILIAFAGPLGFKIKEYTLEKAEQIEQIGNKEIENRNLKNYEAVDIEKSWTETHTDSYFFERVSSDKTNTDYNKWKSNNKGKNSTSAVSTFTIDAPKNMEYSFNWTVSSESNYDKLTITCNGTTILNGISGTKNGTQKVTLKSGTNTLKATYSKDSSSASGDDCATITLPNISVCKNKQTDEISNHIYDKGKITKEPTCTENGEKTYTCKNCGHTKTEVVNKLGHTTTTIGEKCTRCGETILRSPEPAEAVDNVYCIYYDDGEMTISQNEIEQEAGRTVVEKGFYYNPRYCTQQMTTVRFVGAVKPKSCESWFGQYDNGCSKLKEVKNIENLYTTACTNMSNMFCFCSSLTSLDVSGFDTSKVINMEYMFSHCSSLTNLDVSEFDTSKVTDMSYMFTNCDNLISLDISHFNTSNVTDMAYMFNGCNSLISLDVSHFDTSNVTNMNEMFCNCHSLTSLDVSHFDTSNVTTIYGMFRGSNSLTNLDVSNFDTSKVTNMYGMFSDCSNLTSLDVREFDTSNVKDMSYMFDTCKTLINLDLSNFDTSKVTNMHAMFLSCENLTSLDLSKFDTSNVRDMSYMFSYCRISLDLSNFDTRNVRNMNSMFSSSSLTSLDLSGFDTSNVTDMSYMFSYCSNLTSLDLSEWNTEKVTNVERMFLNSPKIKSITAPQTVKDKILNSKSYAYVPSGVTWIIK